MHESEQLSPEEIASRCTIAMRGLKLHALGIAKCVGTLQAVNVMMQALASIVADWGDEAGDQAFLDDMRSIFPANIARFRAANQMHDVLKGGAKNDA